MKIERGIIGFNNRNEMIVRSPGQIYHLNNESFFSRSLKENDKVLGVIVDNRFCVCREFISEKGEFIFGYLQGQASFKKTRIQTLCGYDQTAFDPYFSDYILGPVVSVCIL